MKCVILAAGYATRLYPLTRDFPKSLLEVAGRTILDRILDKVERIPDIDEILVVSNSRFFRHFRGWEERKACGAKISILDDGSTDNDNRLGAVADLAFAVKAGALNADCLVLAGDNLFDFELVDFVSFALARKADCITTHVLEDRKQLSRTGVIEIDKDFRVLSFEEKPKDPKSTYAVPPFYFYRKDTLPLLELFLKEGHDPDAPGNFIPWLLGKRTVFAYLFSGRRYDIGNRESYEAAQKLFSEREAHRS